MMRFGSGLVALTIAIVFLLALTTSAAAQTDGFALSQFHPAPSSTDGFGVMLPAPPPHLTLDGRLALDYAHGALVVSQVAGDTRTVVGSVVEHSFIANVALSLGIENWLGLWVALPVTLYQSGDYPAMSAGTTLSAQALGDMELGVRALLYGEREAPAEGFSPSLGAAASISFPTGNADALAGDDGFGVRAQVIGALLHSLVTPIVGLGISYRPERSYLATTTGPELSWVLGLHLRTGIVRVETELRGGTTLTNGQAFSGDAVPIEVLLGGRLMLGAVTVGLAVDAGVTQALGTPDVRVVGTFGFAAPLGGDGGATDDNAGDNDADGEDTDGDGVPNASDRCPEEPEDADGHADTDGCPEDDADGDGVSDEDDFCPEQPETPNQYLDDDGCPDGVEIEGDIVRPSEAVTFARRTAEIDRDAQTALRLVAEMLRAHEEIALLQIEGHASHEEGNEARALSLSEQRAEAVLEWLSSHGVDAARLTFAGMGADVPVEGAEDESVNRRVTFRVLERH